MIIGTAAALVAASTAAHGVAKIIANRIGHEFNTHMFSTNREAAPPFPACASFALVHQSMPQITGEGYAQVAIRPQLHIVNILRPATTS